ncbi:TonB-dependent receptor [Labilibaculum sp. K2S]|uniref:SusC/RagA family TonB-linked outer membrane protein n=1 Tax=Labilibaculum sp. K2S TaxID=3056386 RepID=UPI0025A4121C|nr:TonB-dependent receptor [Labilibaculum sp. K2S]MDM8159532.1 TonB-dependent receptor [Labilibaculum sp. K2S]
MKKSENFNAPTHCLKTGKLNNLRWLLKSSMLLLMVFCNVAIIFGQSSNTEITGKITDSSGFGIPGVNISLKATTIGTVSDIDGSYSISASSENVIVYSFIGYTTQEVLVGDQTTINVVLAVDALSVDEVVVIGYGVQKKSVVTAAISSIKGEDIEKTSTGLLEQALQGKSAGVSILPTSGAPGAGVKIRIRGVGSNGNSSPLYIVDGMKTGAIDNIEPADIASVEILKDAASAAIYGNEGANGVLIITTKSGKGKKNEINYNFSYGIQSISTKAEMMNAQEYMQFQTEAGNSINDDSGVDTNWIDEVSENASIQKHYLSFAGGSDKTSYMLSGSYIDQDGAIGGSNANFERFTTRINLKSEMKEWLDVGVNMSYSHQTRRTISEDDEYRGIMNNVLLADPLSPVFDSNNAGWVSPSGKAYGKSKYVTGEIQNPAAFIEMSNNKFTVDKVLGMAFASLKPVKGLTITSRIGLDLAYNTQNRWAPIYNFSTEQKNETTNVEDNIDKYYTWLWENFASYNTTFGDHDFTFLAGTAAEKYVHPNYYLKSGPMVKEGSNYAYHDYTLDDTQDRTGGKIEENTKNSYFGRVSYNYAGKYMAEATLRYDGHSNLAEGNKWDTFPSISIGWLASEEDFWKSDVINYLKLRASWGQNGSVANTPGFEDREFWQSGLRYPNPTGGLFTGGTRVEKAVNTDLRWEKSEQTNIGAEVRAFNSKLTFAADYYEKTTKDLIVTGETAPSVGNNANPMINGGNVSNKGFDFELGYKDNFDGLEFSINLNLATVKNEVTSLTRNTPVPGAEVRSTKLTWFEQGEPIWYYKGYKTNGINPTNGSINIVDVNGDGEITSDDMTNIGSPHPDLIFGANLNLAYKGFDFAVFMQGTSGNENYMAWFRNDRPYSNKPAYFFTDRWTQAGDIASMPKPDNSSDDLYRSDLMVKDASYIRIKQIQLGYNIPKKYLNKLHLSKLRTFVSLDDFFTFTKYPGLDPEAGTDRNDSQGIDRGVYPSIKKVMFGFSVGL